MGLSRRTRWQAARSAIEHDAGETIDARIADGRPPITVWRVAAARQAATGLPPDAWYRATRTSVGDAGPGRIDHLFAGAGTDLVLHVVWLPLRG